MRLLTCALTGLCLVIRLNAEYMQDDLGNNEEVENNGDEGLSALQHKIVASKATFMEEEEEAEEGDEALSALQRKMVAGRTKIMEEEAEEGDEALSALQRKMVAGRTNIMEE